jgi:hypothetical protein
MVLLYLPFLSIRIDFLTGLIMSAPYYRYVDITEAIDSADASFLDNSEFQDADAIPLQEALPLRHYLDREVRPVPVSKYVSLGAGM